MNSTAEHVCLEVLSQRSSLFSLKRPANSATSQQVKSHFSIENMKRECPTYMHISISIYFKTLYVNVHVYVYTCVWIRIIQARKPLWRWSCLIPGKTAQPDCSGPCPVECQALPDVKKFSWYWIGIFFPAPCDCCLCPTPCTSEDSLTYTQMSISGHTHTYAHRHTHKVYFVLPLCIWEITSKWSLALASAAIPISSKLQATVGRIWHFLPSPAVTQLQFLCII